MIESTLRDATDLVKKRGKWKRAGPVKLLVFEQGSLQIVHRTPFQKLPAESDGVRYALAVRSGKPKLPYRLLVWHDYKKVLNAEWDDHGRQEILTYRPGVWETRIAFALATVSGRPSR